jgi:hypothetical protein
VAALTPVLTPVLALLAVALVLAVFAPRLLRGGLGRSRPRPGTSAAVERRPVQDVAADVRRLTRQLALVPSGAPLVRWRALWAAYDAVLAEAAEQLDVAHELGSTCVGTPRDIERVRVLAALESAGLAVRG